MQVRVCMQGVQHRGSEEYQVRASPVRHAALHFSPLDQLVFWLAKTILIFNECLII